MGYSLGSSLVPGSAHGVPSSHEGWLRRAAWGEAWPCCPPSFRPLGDRQGLSEPVNLQTKHSTREAGICSLSWAKGEECSRSCSLLPDGIQEVQVRKWHLSTCHLFIYKPGDGPLCASLARHGIPTNGQAPHWDPTAWGKQTRSL